jgi:hypothetical protein
LLWLWNEERSNLGKEEQEGYVVVCNHVLGDNVEWEQKDHKKGNKFKIYPRGRIGRTCCFVESGEKCHE